MNYQIFERTEKLTAQMRNNLREILNEIYREMDLQISQQKEPYLREILEATRNNTQIEAKYTASDILTILEKLQESLPFED
jgi:hypothetical protein